MGGNNRRDTLQTRIFLFSEGSHSILIDLSLATALNGPRLLALSIHVDGRHQSADVVAAVVANSASAQSLRVLYISDHVLPASAAANDAPADTLTDVGL